MLYELHRPYVLCISSYALQLYFDAKFLPQHSCAFGLFFVLAGDIDVIPVISEKYYFLVGEMSEEKSMILSFIKSVNLPFPILLD